MIPTHKMEPTAVPIRIPMVGPERIISLSSFVLPLAVKMSGRTCLKSSAEVIVLIFLFPPGKHSEKGARGSNEARIIPYRKLAVIHPELTSIYRADISRGLIYKPTCDSLSPWKDGKCEREWQG